METGKGCQKADENAGSPTDDLEKQLRDFIKEHKAARSAWQRAKVKEAGKIIQRELRSIARARKKVTISKILA